jgi:phage repressor protein C with HTH and peptisase S24 domain
MKVINNPVVEVPEFVQLQYPNCFALAVRGDFMAPNILEGDSVIVDPDMKPRGNGQELAVLRILGEMYICKFIRVAGQIVMLFDNAAYASTTFPERAVMIMGKVVWNANDASENVKTPLSAGHSQEGQTLNA